MAYKEARPLLHQPLPTASTTIASAQDLAALVRDPNWMPSAYDVRRNALNFAYLDRQSRAEAVFLDGRFVRSARLSGYVSATELPRDMIREVSGPLHFIFHTAFCCSTLLTRALDQPGFSMGLKEPSVFAGFARPRASGRVALGSIGALETTLNLLSRPLIGHETQVVKLNNVFTALIPQMMGLRPDAKAILLYSPLENFLRAVTRRGPEGRVYARELYQALSIVMPLDVSFTDEQLMLQTDMQIAAQAWLMQVACFRQLELHYPHRVRTLSSDTLIADPAAALAKLCDFLAIDLDDEARASIVNGPVFREHAKKPGVAFDGAAYAQQRQSAEGYGVEIARAVQWASKLAQQTETPMTLGDTLVT